jgi:hypothetical protein
MNEMPQQIARDPWACGLSWVLGLSLLVCVFLWLLSIEPYVRRRNRVSTFFLLPWAPWKDYLDGLELPKRHHKPPLSVSVFGVLSLVPLARLIALGLRLARGGELTVRSPQRC